MNEKEAFRYLSHRFHGKGPGKKKTEKRMNRFKEKEWMNKMSSVDTPLHTVSRNFIFVEYKKRRFYEFRCCILFKICLINHDYLKINFFYLNFI